MAQLQRWDPFRELNRLASLSGLWHSTEALPVGRAKKSWSLPLDVIQGADDVIVSASIPGADPDAIKVTINDGVLSIASSSNQEQLTESDKYILRECRSGTFSRSIVVPSDIDTERVKSSYHNGILTITLPKAESSRTKQIEVEISK